MKIFDNAPDCYAFMPDSDKSMKYKYHCKECDLRFDCWSDSTPENQDTKLMKIQPLKQCKQ